jgi:hypothetical protein
MGREIISLPFLIMRNSTVIYIRWKLTGRIEVFVNLGKLYSVYTNEILGVSRWALDRKNLFEGYENSIVEIRKLHIK